MHGSALAFPVEEGFGQERARRIAGAQEEGVPTRSLIVSAAAGDGRRFGRGHGRGAAGRIGGVVGEGAEGGAVAVDGGLVVGEEGLPEDSVRICDPALLGFGVAAGGCASSSTGRSAS